MRKSGEAEQSHQTITANNQWKATQKNSSSSWEGRYSAGRRSQGWDEVGGIVRVGGAASDWTSRSIIVIGQGLGLRQRSRHRPIRPRGENNTVQAAGIRWRTQDQEIELRTIQQVSQNFRSRSRAESRP